MVVHQQLQIALGKIKTALHLHEPRKSYMAKRRNLNAAHADRPIAHAPSGSATSNTARLKGWKLWCFRILALVGVPALLFAVVELVLRLGGFGYPTTFLIPASHDGQKVFQQNNQFGWRFFPPQLARQPYPLTISQSPSDDTIRIFVFGESAAKGDPDPHFGLPRMLETTLSLRHPGVRFQVINTAMTAINSHAVRAIARDCENFGGDIWVIYMGNNEVVGPFGAGTVFGPKTPPLPVIRGALALKTLRTGQLLDATLLRAQRSSGEKSEWAGMEMFLDQQVRADHPRMNGVYRHFERNLADMIQAGRRSGASVVLSTVAVNLRDCAPFASLHRANLSGADKTKWNEHYQLGLKAQETSNHQEAAARFEEAAQLDNTFAELRFRQGQCALALGKTAEAQQHLQAARDLDTLRFRCDARLNEITRSAGTNREAEPILLADVERVFARQSSVGLRDEDLFYEHVHLTFVGNHLLARTIAEQVEKLLPKHLAATSATNHSWPSQAECARRMGWSDWSQLTGWKGVLPRLRNPPFTDQVNHQSQMQRVQAKLESLASATQPDGISNALRICEAAITMSPSDAALYAQLAALKNAAGDFVGATAAARRELELLPSDAEGWSQLGIILARQRQFAEATDAFDRAVQLDSQDMGALENKAQSLAAQGQDENAIREFRRVLALKPHLGLAWLHLGQVLERKGDKAEAEECYRQALANRSQNVQSLIELAGFCQSRGWFEAAATNYIEAAKADQTNAKLQLGAGQNFLALKRYVDAVRHSAEAVRLSPGFAEAHLLHGIVLGRQGLIEEAIAQFRDAVRLKPDLLDARLNLGIALARRNPSEALENFEVVLRESPANTTALKYAQQIRERLANQKP